MQGVLGPKATPLELHGLMLWAHIMGLFNTASLLVVTSLVVTRLVVMQASKPASYIQYQLLWLLVGSSCARLCCTSAR